MSVAPVTEASPAARPEFFRLPKPGLADPFFGFSRTFYYALEQRGLLKLVRICDAHKKRGITLVDYKAVSDFVRSQMGAGK